MIGIGINPLQASQLFQDLLEVCATDWVSHLNSSTMHLKVKHTGNY